MTDEVSQARDEQLISALVVTLTAKHSIESEHGSFRISRMRDGQFLVAQKLAKAMGVEELEDLFDDARAAVAYYLDLCELTY